MYSSWVYGDPVVVALPGLRLVKTRMPNHHPLFQGSLSPYNCISSGIYTIVLMLLSNIVTCRRIRGTRESRGPLWIAYTRIVKGIDRGLVISAQPP